MITEHGIIDDKECTMCHAVKPLSEFNKRKRSADGHAYACTLCQRKESRKNRMKRLEVSKIELMPDSLYQFLYVPKQA